MNDTSLPLPHSSEPIAPRSSPALIVVTGVLSMVLWMTVIAQLVVFIPKFERLTSEFRIKLPLLTEWIVRDARWAVPALAVVVLLGCIAFGRRSSWPWLFLLILLPLVIDIVVGLSIYFPYMELLEGLEGAAK
jgi:ABC-type polysaccharide/polyol phosphate export permease